MPAMRCPACNIVLTKEEFAQGSCPSCQADLEARAPALDPVDAPRPVPSARPEPKREEADSPRSEQAALGIHYFTLWGFLRRQYAGLTLAIVFILLGIAIPLLSPDPRRDLLYATIPCVIGVGLLGLFVWNFVNRIQWVKSADAELSWRRRGQTHAQPWPVVRDVYYASVKIQGVEYQSMRLCFATEPMAKLYVTDAIDALDSLADAVRQRTLATRAQVIKDEERTKGYFAFGPVQYDQRSIRVKGKEVAWDEIDHLEFSWGFFRIYRKKGWNVELRLQVIPNYDILFLQLESEGRPIREE